MNKGFVLFLVLVFIFTGIYGAFYFIKLEKAEESINKAIMDIKEGKYEEGLDRLKIVFSNYNFNIVKAPTMYLIGDTYEKLEKYDNAIEAHRTLISNSNLASSGNWYVQSVISISKLYRNGLVEAPTQKIQSLEEYLRLLIEKIKIEMSLREKTGIEALEGEIRKIINNFIRFNFDLAINEPSLNELVTSLETELGFVYLKQEKYEKAEEIFNRLNTPTSRFGLAQVYLETGDIDKGLLLLERLIDIDSTGNIRMYYIQKSFDFAVQLYNQKKYNDSIRIFERVVSQTEDTDYAEFSLFYMAQHFYSTNNPSDSLKYINQILSNSITLRDEEALLLKGYVYYDRREYMRALKAFNDFINLYPKSSRRHTAQEWKSMCERTIKYLG